jgi:hypothetical protein
LLKQLRFGLRAKGKSLCPSRSPRRLAASDL